MICLFHSVWANKSKNNTLTVRLLFVSLLFCVLVRIALCWNKKFGGFFFRNKKKNTPPPSHICFLTYWPENQVINFLWPYRILCETFIILLEHIECCVRHLWDHADASLCFLVLGLKMLLVLSFRAVWSCSWNTSSMSLPTLSVSAREVKWREPLSFFRWVEL